MEGVSTRFEVGLSLAPIHGTVHWSQLTPLLLEAFGKEWFETGCISVHFMKMAPRNLWEIDRSVWKKVGKSIGSR